MAETKCSLLPKYAQTDDLSQECMELISTLPMENRGLMTIFQYQGHWYIKNHMQGVLSCQKHFQAHDTDIILVTTPKSGTTWLKALIFTLLNRKRYLNSQYHPLLTTNPQVLVPNLEIDLYNEKDFLPDLNSLSSPRFFSTHFPFLSLPKSVKESSCKMVYLCRDPKDTFVSMRYFMNKITPEGEGTISLEDMFEMFYRGVTPWGPFWEHVLGYWKESIERPEKVMFMKYEEMKKQPAFHLRKLAEFVGFPFSTEEESAGVLDDIINLCSFENLSNLDVNKTGKLPVGMENKYFFRRGEVGDGEKMLTNEMIEKLNTINELKLAKHGLSF